MLIILNGGWGFDEAVCRRAPDSHKRNRIDVPRFALVFLWSSKTMSRLCAKIDLYLWINEAIIEFLQSAVAVLVFSAML